MQRSDGVERPRVVQHSLSFVVLELLADEFTEIGTRGRQYDLVSIVREMSRGRSQEVVVKDWEVREIYPTVMLCTYRTTGPTGRR